MQNSVLCWSTLTLSPLILSEHIIHVFSIVFITSGWNYWRPDQRTASRFCFWALWGSCWWKINSICLYQKSLISFDHMRVIQGFYGLVFVSFWSVTGGKQCDLQLYSTFKQWNEIYGNTKIQKFFLFHLLPAELCCFHCFAETNIIFVINLVFWICIFILSKHALNL